MNTVLDIALSKLRNVKNNIWAATLSYSEVVALEGDGYILQSNREEQSAFIREELRKGTDEVGWFFFNVIGTHQPKPLKNAIVKQVFVAKPKRSRKEKQEARAKREKVL